MGFTYSEAYNIPIWQRRWFLTRTQKEINRTNNEDGGAGTRAAHQNSPDMRAWMERQRARVPAKLRRFTEGITRKC